MDDFRLNAIKHAYNTTGIRQDGVYYLTKKDYDEYTQFVAYFYNERQLILEVFGSEDSIPRIDLWMPILNRIAAENGVNRKGQYRFQSPDKINIELCNGYPTRGYHFIKYEATLLDDRLLIRRGGIRAYKRIMKDYRYDFDKLGAGHVDTLVFRKF